MEAASIDAAFISLPMADQASNHSQFNAVAHCEFTNGLTLFFS